MTSTSESAPDHGELSDILHRAGYTESASHFHGLLCGALCVVSADQLSAPRLLEEVGPMTSAPGAHDQDALLRLRDGVCADLQSADMDFAPLLPDDAQALHHRVDALSAWCGGFLYGLSSRQQLDLRAMSEEARETLRDFAQFTQAGFDASGDLEAEENAYAELVEYVRVGAQLLFLELRPRAASPEDESTTLH